MRELPIRPHAPFLEKGRIVHQEAVIAQHLLAPGIKFIDDGHTATIGKLPLLLRPIDEAAVMVQISQTLYETGLRCATDECVQKIGSQVLVAIEELEELDIAGREFDALA